jgi:hypothetical protein
MDEKAHSSLRQSAALEALRNQLHNLEDTFADLLKLYKSMPDGEYRDRLFYEISALDSIADVIRQALDSINA